MELNMYHSISTLVCSHSKVAGKMFLGFIPKVKINIIYLVFFPNVDLLTGVSYHCGTFTVSPFDQPLPHSGFPSENAGCLASSKYNYVHYK